jgi:hypothetical protein
VDGGEQLALIFGSEGSSVGWFLGVEMRSGGVGVPPLAQRWVGGTRGSFNWCGSARGRVLGFRTTLDTGSPIYMGVAPKTCGRRTPSRSELALVSILRFVRI